MTQIISHLKKKQIDIFVESEITQESLERIKKILRIMKEDINPIEPSIKVIVTYALSEDNTEKLNTALAILDLDLESRQVKTTVMNSDIGRDTDTDTEDNNNIPRGLGSYADQPPTLYSTIDTHDLIFKNHINKKGNSNGYTYSVKVNEPVIDLSTDQACRFVIKVIANKEKIQSMVRAIRQKNKHNNITFEFDFPFIKNTRSTSISSFFNKIVLDEKCDFKINFISGKEGIYDQKQSMVVTNPESKKLIQAFILRLPYHAEIRLSSESDIIDDIDPTYFDMFFTVKRDRPDLRINYTEANKELRTLLRQSFLKISKASTAGSSTTTTEPVSTTLSVIIPVAKQPELTSFSSVSFFSPPRETLVPIPSSSSAFQPYSLSLNTTDAQEVDGQNHAKRAKPETTEDDKRPTQRPRIS